VRQRRKKQRKRREREKKKEKKKGKREREWIRKPQSPLSLQLTTHKSHGTLENHSLQ
jgi:hypothetical protein